MLFMDIWTWGPEKRHEVQKRWSEFKYPEDIKLVGEWLDLTGNRFFVLYEVDDPKIMLSVNDMWLDIAKVDSRAPYRYSPQALIRHSPCLLLF
ncbi:MAG: hypothetical protein O8C55_13585 [Candidatus Methanoperedens sp.]|nr:hypothetical protein [Candidatus Methanoperedens sp.]